MQLIGSSLFFVNYFLIGAWVGALLNVLSMLRAIVYWKRELFRADKIIWVYAICLADIAVYVMSFTVFGTEPLLENFLVELLPVAGIMLTTVSFYLGDARRVRFIGLFNAPLWLTYNIIVFTVGGIVCEAVGLCSIVIGILRYDIRKKTKR